MDWLRTIYFIIFTLLTVHVNASQDAQRQPSRGVFAIPQWRKKTVVFFLQGWLVVAPSRWLIIPNRKETVQNELALAVEESPGSAFGRPPNGGNAR